MSWREAFITHFGPGNLAGITLGNWLRILRENQFRIEPPCWGRALAITASTLSNTPLAWLEKAIYGRRIANTPIAPPLFILGIWRSGTTLLHNLFAQDARFAFPNNYQVSFPLTFLLTEPFNAGFVGLMTPRTRPQDHVTIGMHEPQEDEFAFASLIGRGFTLAWALPRSMAFYNRYLTLRACSEAEIAEWKSALQLFVQKLSFQYRKPLVLKSPGHTCRIRLLLELFPDARFVHIHRNPFDVFQSARHTARKVEPWVALQRRDFGDLDDQTIRQYKEVYDTFFAERELIPAGRYAEVGFEELERDPIGRMRWIYDTLSLPGFVDVAPALERYLQTISGYQKNVFADLPAELRRRIASEWQRCFVEWGYAT